MKGKKQTVNNKRRGIAARVLAGMLCLCMMLSVLQTDVPVYAANTTVLLYAWHTGDEEGKLLDSPSFEDGVMTIKPLKDESNPKETFTAFSVTAGQSAVENITYNSEDPFQSTVTIKEDPSVPLVKIHMFYTSDLENADGMSFGKLASLGLPESEDPEVDTAYVSKAKYDKVIKGIDPTGSDSEMITVYDTSAGLHTNKSVEQSTLAGDFGDDVSGSVDEVGPRTFDVTLESWFAGKSLANVGLILDASGSMAWTLDDLDALDKDSKGGVAVRLDEKELQALGINLSDFTDEKKTIMLTAEQVEKLNGMGILDQTKTDNSLLGYSDYTYYVYDGHEKAYEYVPLAYWDGECKEAKELAKTLEIPQKENLIGYYPLDGSLENKAREGSTAQFIDLAKKDGDEVKFSSAAETFGEGIQNGFYQTNPSNAVNGSQYLMMRNDQGRTDGLTNVGNILLDASLDSDTFTISFAVRSKQTNKLEDIGLDGKTFRPLSDILYIGPLNTALTNTNHYRLYRDGMASGSSKGDSIRLDTEMGTSVNTNMSLQRYPTSESPNKLFSSKVWYVITLVADGTNITAYINGDPAYGGDKSRSEYELADFITAGTNRIIIGGADPYYDKASLFIDEVYVYDAALDADEVKRLSTKTRTNAATMIKVNVAEKDGKNLASVKTNKKEDELDATNLAGWYYVNSSSNVEDASKGSTIKDVGTGKEFHPVVARYQYYEEAFEKSEIGENAFQWGGEGHKQALPPPGCEVDADGKMTKWDRSQIKSGPSQFYVDKEGYLYCIFNPSQSYLSYSKVYKKFDGRKIKAEELQEALGMFANKLEQLSPDSQVGAVRFSTINYDYNNPKNKNLSELVMLNWTSDPGKITEMLNLQRGKHGAIGEDNAEEGQHNYLLTGGTYVETGLEAFQTQLLNGDGSLKGSSGSSGDTKKYLIIFTDGQDDSIGRTTETTEDKKGNVVLKYDTYVHDTAIEDANTLKGMGWTIYSVMLTGGALTGDALESATNFLQEISGAEETSLVDKGLFVHNTTEESGGLAAIFNDIGEEIGESLTGYTLQDYIDPRFNLVAKTNPSGKEKLICLNAGGKIEVKEISDSAAAIDALSGEEVVVGPDGKADLNDGSLPVYIYGENTEIDTKNPDSGTKSYTKAELCWDSSKQMYYIKWTKQTIPSCSVDASVLRVWRAKFTLRAKDDFIGGNTVLTNGQDENMNYVYYPTDTDKSSGTSDMKKEADDEKPSKGFPRVTVNVGLLPRDTKRDQTIYLGETLRPLEIAKALVKELKDSDGGVDGSHYYWEYLERYARALVEKDDPTGTAVLNAEKVQKKLEEILADLIVNNTGENSEGEAKKKVLTIPYAYLPAGNNDDVQAGLPTHQADILGTLSYTWENVEGKGVLDPEKVLNDSGDGSYVTLKTDQRQYQIKVTFNPLEDGDASSAEENEGERKFDPDINTETLQKRIAANNGSSITPEYSGLISDSDYRWKPTKAKENRKRAGTAQTQKEGTGIGTVNIVRGELAMEVVAERGLLDQWFRNHSDQDELTLKVEVKRSNFDKEPSAESLITGSALLTGVSVGGGLIFELPEQESSGLEALDLSSTGLGEAIDLSGESLHAPDFGTPSQFAENPEENADSPTGTDMTVGADQPDPAGAANTNQVMTVQNEPEWETIGNGVGLDSISEPTETEDWDKALTVTIKQEELDTAETDSEENLHFYSYIDIDKVNAEQPQPRPFGDYTLSLAESTKDNPFTELDYATETDYTGHFNKNQEGGVINEENGEQETNFIAPEFESGSTPEESKIGFYFGTKGQRTPENVKNPEEYLNDRLGMVILSPETGSLTVEKTVSGAAGEKEHMFNFTVTLQDESGNPLEDINGWYGEDLSKNNTKPDPEMDSETGGMYFERGVANFKLKNGQSRTALYLPAGVKYTVEETIDDDSTESKGYQTTIVTNDPTAKNPDDTAAGTVSGAVEEKTFTGRKIAGTVAKDAVIATDTGVKVSFDNHRDPAMVTLPIKKNMAMEEGNELQTEYEFTFVLAPVEPAQDEEGNPDGGALCKEDPSLSAGAGETVEYNGSQYVPFDKIEQTIKVKAAETEGSLTDFLADVIFVKPGTYRYTLTEMVPAESVKQEGITYNSENKTYEIMVEVTEPDEGGALTATILLDKTEVPEGGAVFTNRYDPTPVSVPLMGIKKINDSGSAVTVEGDFNATLTPQTGAPMPTPVVPGTSTGSNPGTGTSGEIIYDADRAYNVSNTKTGDRIVFDFGSIEFTKQGIYYYKIAEVTGSNTNITYDTTAYVVKIEVKDEGGHLSAKVYKQDTDGNFTEMSKSTGEAAYEFSFRNIRRGSLTVSKEVKGEAATDGKEFDFTVTLTIPENLRDVLTIADITGTFGETDVTFAAVADNDWQSIASFKLEDKEQKMFTNLPAGVEYVVTETEDPDEKYTVTINGALATANSAVSGSGAASYSATGTIPAGSDGLTLTVQNERTPAEVELTVEKKMNLTEGYPLQKEYDFTFVLEPDNTKSNPEADPIKGTNVTKVIHISKAEKITPVSPENFFDGKKFAKEGKYYYTLKEIPPTPNEAGITYDEQTYNVTVDVHPSDATHPGNLVAEISLAAAGGSGVGGNGTASGNSEPGSSHAVAEFTNTYYPEKTQITLNGTKSIKYGNLETEDVFGFTLTAVTPGDAPLPADVDVSNDAGTGKFVFGPIEYTKKGVYTYEVRETDGSEPGISYDAAVYTVQVTVTDVEGRLSASVKWKKDTDSDFQSVDGTDGIFEFLDFVNKKIGSLTVSKEVEGDAGNQEEYFDFTVTLTVPEDAKDSFGAAEIRDAFKKTSAGAGTGTGTDNVTVSAGTGDRTYVVSFKLKHGESVTAAGLPAGTTYSVAESLDSSAGYKAEVVPSSAVSPGAGATPITSDGTIEQGKTASAAFTNTREPATVTLPLEKNLAYEGDGYNPPAHTFTFTLKGISSDPTGLEIPMPTGAANPANPANPTSAEVSVTVGAGEKSKTVDNIFDGVKFTRPGTFTYTLTENNGDYSDVKNDTTSRTITVTVTPGTDGQLQATALVNGNSSAAGTTKAAFTNTYQPLPATLSLDVSKRLKNDTLLNAGDFAFTLTAKDGAPMPADVAGEQQSSPFTAYNVKGTAASTASEKAATATVNFGEITYTKPGTYTYSIKEKKGTDSSIEYDGTEYTVTVTVTDESGQLKASAVYSGTPAGTSSSSSADRAEFINKRLLGNLTVTKTVAGDAETDSTGKSFHFKVTLNRTDIAGLYGTTGNGMTFMAEAGGSYAVFDLKAGESVTAVGLPAGTTYTVEETSPGRDGYNVTYTVTTTGTATGTAAGTTTTQSDLGDNKAYTVTGTIPANSTAINGTAEVKFTNTRNYAAAHLKARKTLTGLDTANTAEYDFTFELTPDHTEAKTGSTTAPENPLKDARKRKVEEISSSSQTKTTIADFFEGVKFKKEGTYYYTLTESSNPSYTGVQYDGTTFTVKVTVSAEKDAPGTLTAEVEVTPDSGTDKVTTDTDGVTVTKVAEFTNIYAPDAISAYIEGKKEFAGGTLAGQDFTFKLTEGSAQLAAGQSGAAVTVPMPEGATADSVEGGKRSIIARNNREGEFKFGPILYEEAGVYTYTVKETDKTDMTHIAYDDTVYTVTVTVADNGGKLEVSGVTYANSTSGGTETEMTFTNTKITGDLTISKQVEGSDADRNKAFAFKVTLTIPEQYADEFDQSAIEKAFKDGTPGREVTVTELPAAGTTGEKQYTATFTLKADESIKAVDLPVGTKYAVEETDSGKYTVSAKINGAEVTPDAQGKVLAEGSIAADEAKVAFTNHRDKPTAVSVKLEGEKKLAGSETELANTLRKTTYTFELSAGGAERNEQTLNAPMPNAASLQKVTESITGDGTFTFDDITYAEEGTYYYTLSEAGIANSGIACDKKKYTIRVEVKEETIGSLAATVSYRVQGSTGDWLPVQAGSEGHSLTFTNRMKATASLYVEKIMKVGTHGSHLGAKEFTFILEPRPEEGQPENPLKQAVETKIKVGEQPSGSAEKVWDVTGTKNLLENVRFEEAGTYSYTLREKTTDSPGVHFDNKLRNVTVEVKDTDGILSATVKVETGDSGETSGQATNSATAAFTNRYEPSEASVALQGEKELKGGSAGNREFTFELTAVSAESQTAKEIPMPKGTAAVKTGADGKPAAGETTSCTISNKVGRFHFDNITFNTVGTYTYRLKEVFKEDPYITYDDAEYTIVVKVTEGADSTETQHDADAMQAEVTYTKTSGKGEVLDEGTVGEDFTFKFTNVNHGDLLVEKKVEGSAADETDEFSFRVTLTGQGADEVKDGWYGTKPADENDPQSGDGMYFEGGSATFTLKAGENRKATGLPVGVSYIVEETDGLDYAVSSITGAELASGNKVLGQIPAGETVNVVFTNTKEKTTAVLRGEKKFPDNAQTTEQFTFVLTADRVEPAAVAAIPMPNGKEAAVDASGKALTDAEGIPAANAVSTAECGVGLFAFDGITYDHAGTYYYKLTEKKGEDNAVAYDAAEYTIRVTVRNDGGELKAAVFYQKENEGWNTMGETSGTVPAFTNRRKATASLKVRKTLDVGVHGSHLDGKTFTFRLTPDRDTTVQPAHNTITVTVDRNGSWTGVSTEDFFDGTGFEREGIYSYTLNEVNDTQPGVHYTHVAYKVEVAVTEAQDGTLNAAVKLNGGETGSAAVAEFENSYDPDKAKVLLQGKKTMAVGDPGNGEFTFILSANEDTPWPDGATPQIGTDGKWTYEKTNDGDGLITFGTVTYEKTGTYVYEIREKNGGRPDIAYDDAVYKVTVVVEEGTVPGEDTHEGVAKMTYRITYEKAGETVEPAPGDYAIHFENRRQTGSLKVTKKVEGSAASRDDVFTFMVKLEDESVNGWYGNEPANGGAEKSGDGMNFVDGVARFTLKADEYREASGLPVGVSYFVEETNGLDYTISSINGAEFVSGDRALGQITADSVAEVVITNKKDEAVLSLQGVKRFRNGDLTAGRFSFVLTADHAETDTAAAIPMPGKGSVQTDENGKAKPAAGETASVKRANGSDGSFTFEEMVYKTAGTYYYTLAEESGTDGLVIYDKAVYTIRVDVTNENGELKTNVSYTKDNGTAGTGSSAFIFTNEQRTGGVQVTKVTTGSASSDEDEFEFEMTLSEKINGTYGDMLFADGVAKFSLRHGESAAATGLPVGAEYTVKETNAKGYTPSQDTISGTVEQDKVARVLFENQLDAASAPVSLKVQKELQIGETVPVVQYYEFTFTLTRGTGNPEGDPVSEDRTFSIKVGPDDNWKNSYAVFDNLQFTRPGEYHYTIREKTIEGAGGISYDSEKEITVSVKLDAETRALTAEVTGDVETADDEQTVNFANTYQRDKVGIRLEGRKYLKDESGRNLALEDEQFAFRLRPIGATLTPDAENGTAMAEQRLMRTAAEADGESETAAFEEETAAAEISAESLTETEAAAETPTEILTEAAAETSTEILTEAAAEASTEILTETLTEAPTEMMTESSAELSTETMSEVSTEALSEILTETEMAAETEIGEEELIFEPEPVDVMPVDDLEALPIANTELPAEQVPMPKKTEEDGSAIAKNDRAGLFVFDTIEYTQPGIYRYEIEEEEFEDTAILRDESIYQVTVTVARHATGDLHVEKIAYELDQKAAESVEFTNLTVTPPVLGSLSVSKVVTGEGASEYDMEKEFGFTVLLGDRTISGRYGDMEFNNGVASFALKHGQTMTATGLPADIGYLVRESGNEGYHVSSTPSEPMGVIPADSIASVVYTNEKEAEPTPTPGEEPTPTPTPSEEPTPPPSEEPTPTPTPSEEPTPTPSEEPTPTPTPSEEPTPTPTPSEEPTPTPTPSEEPTPTPGGNLIPTPTPSEEPISTPGEEPTPTPTPSEEPTPTPSEEPESTVTVTKSLDLAGDAIAARNDVFYVAVFEDDDFTEMAYGPIEMRFKEAHSVSVDISGLEPNHIYYVSEVDEYGEVLEVGYTEDGVAFEPQYADGQKMTLDTYGNGTFSFVNEFRHLPSRYYWPDDPDQTEPDTEEEPDTDEEPAETPGSGYVNGGSGTNGGTGSDNAGTGSTIANPAQTGDDTPVAWLFAVLVVSGGTLFFTVKRYRGAGGR